MFHSISKRTGVAHRATPHSLSPDRIAEVDIALVGSCTGRRTDTRTDGRTRYRSPNRGADHSTGTRAEQAAGRGAIFFGVTAGCQQAGNGNGACQFYHGRLTGLTFVFHGFHEYSPRMFWLLVAWVVSRA
jgi:hypothetical protein